MTQELIPPTEDFFSYQWYERDGFTMPLMTESLINALMTDHFSSRIDSTRRKLNELETKLSGRLDSDKYNPDLHSVWNKVSWLRSYIGIWQTCNENNFGIDRDVRMLYPDTGRVMTVWNKRILGERKEGNVLILLSSSSITWLNAVDKWVSEYTVGSTTI